MKEWAMSKFLYVLGVMWVIIGISGCASRFTEASIDSLRIGMPASVVREMFGAPKEVRTAVCGGATAGGEWICETWKYKDPITDEVSDFTFSVQKDGKTLNNWNVKR
jgi:hypothetical protein